jgi:hypothetical protein
MTEQELIKVWKENNIDHVNFNFSCGGDSMDETSIEIFDNDGNLVENSEIFNYLDNEIYNRVDFYEASDGHYMGENGVVEITLIEDDGDEEPYLSYDKQSTSEWYETFTETTKVTLTDKERDFVANYISNINGGDDGEVVNYKTDCILTDEEEKILTELQTKLYNVAIELELDTNADSLDSITYTTNNEDSDVTELTLVGNELTLIVSKSGYVYKDED